MAWRRRDVDVERRPMRIGLVIGMLAQGGAEFQLMTLATGLTERGHDVRVFAYDGASEFDDRLRAAGVTVETAEARNRVQKLRLVRAWLRRGQFDVVHGFMNLASSLTLLARFPQRRPAVIATDYATATYLRHHPLLRAALMTFALADRVVTESELNRANLERLVPWLRGRCVVVRNGLDPMRFAPQPAAVRNDPGTFRFCVVGTVHEPKNPLRVVDAVAELVRRQERGFRVDWYGRLSGTPGSREGEEARERAADAGVTEYIAFHGATSDVVEAYRRADALLHAAIREGFPNAVAEAMACGLPVLVSRVSDLPLVVETARNGFVFDERDPSAIADAMAAVMRMRPEERAAMGRRSRELAVTWFSMDRFFAEHEAMYAAVARVRP